jgi:hypothetical protein
MFGIMRAGRRRSYGKLGGEPIPEAKKKSKPSPAYREVHQEVEPEKPPWYMRVALWALSLVIRRMTRKEVEVTQEYLHARLAKAYADLEEKDEKAPTSLPPPPLSTYEIKSSKEVVSGATITQEALEVLARGQSWVEQIDIPPMPPLPPLPPMHVVPGFSVTKKGTRSTMRVGNMSMSIDTDLEDELVEPDMFDEELDEIEVRTTRTVVNGIPRRPKRRPM